MEPASDPTHPQTGGRRRDIYIFQNTPSRREICHSGWGTGIGKTEYILEGKKKGEKKEESPNINNEEENKDMTRKGIITKIRQKRKRDVKTEHIKKDTKRNKKINLEVIRSTRKPMTVTPSPTQLSEEVAIAKNSIMKNTRKTIHIICEGVEYKFIDVQEKKKRK